MDPRVPEAVAVPQTHRRPRVTGPRAHGGQTVRASTAPPLHPTAPPARGRRAARACAAAPKVRTANCPNSNSHPRRPITAGGADRPRPMDFWPMAEAAVFKTSARGRGPALAGGVPAAPGAHWARPRCDRGVSALQSPPGPGAPVSPPPGPLSRSRAGRCGRALGPCAQSSRTRHDEGGR